MLDQFGKKLQGAVLGVIVAMLCAVFILQFGGPQAQGCAKATGAGYAARVYDETITDGDFRSAYTLAGGPRYPLELAKQSHLRELVLDGLIERNLLAREARSLGYRATEDDVMSRLATEGVIYLTRPVDAPADFPGGPIPIEFKDEDGHFDREAASGFIRYNLRRSIAEFAEAQIAETLAERMRETVIAGVTVSPEEVWDSYRREKESVTIEYVRYSPTYYRDQLVPTPTEVDAWLAANAERVNTEYTARRTRYTGLEKQVRARHILIKAAEDAEPAVREAARARAEAIRARALAGEDFAVLARLYSEDDGSARRGGDLGYNPRGRMVAPFDEAQFATAPGQLSAVVQTNFGYHIIKVEGLREGDVPQNEALREIAEELYREERSKTLAQEAATAAIASLRGGETMEQLGNRLRAATAPPPVPAVDPLAPPPAVAPLAPVERSDPYAPRVEESRPFGRGDTPIPGQADNGPLVRAAYELTAESPLPSAALQLGDDWVVFRLKARSDATREGMSDEDRARLTASLLGQKQREALVVYVHGLVRAAESDGALRRNPEVLQYEQTEDGEPVEEEGESASN